MNHTNQSGRSMIEMLGVLAIIGVLSVGGIAGYSKAMMKFKINKSIDQISQIVANTRTLYARQKNYGNLSGKVAYKANLAPKEMFEGSGSDYTMTNAFGGKVGLASDWNNKKHFYVYFNGLPDEACIELATQDWGSDASSGLIAVGVSGITPVVVGINKNCSGINSSDVVVACSRGNTVSIPMPVDVAVDICSNGENTVSLLFE